MMSVLRGLHPAEPKGLLLALAEKHKERSPTASIPLEVVRELPLVRHVIASYNSAACDSEKRQLLSILAIQFKHADLATMHPQFTAWRCRQALAHARAWGAGRSPPAALKIVRQRVQITALKDAVAFIYDPKYSQQVAFGDRNIFLESTGTELVVSAVMRTVLREHIWEEYASYYTDADGNFHGAGFTPTIMHLLLGVCVPYHHM